MAIRVYEVFHCQCVVRIDFIYQESEDRPYMLEVNTIPGQSAASIIPQQVRAQGGELMDFYSELLDAALKPAQV
jgi:D-alanine-D-alanine ligase